MDNQMKVCFVTLDEFNRIWSKAMPQERYGPGLSTLSFMDSRYNTLFIVGKQEDFIADVADVNPKGWKV